MDRGIEKKQGTPIHVAIVEWSELTLAPVYGFAAVTVHTKFQSGSARQSFLSLHVHSLLRCFFLDKASQCLLKSKTLAINVPTTRPRDPACHHTNRVLLRSNNMCKTCCSHESLSLQCNPQTTYHLGHFPLSNNGILFPSEHLYLDAHMASTLHLVADVNNDAMDYSAHPTWPAAKLLADVLAISPTANSAYGALAVLQLVSHSRNVRFLAHVIGRYRRISPPDYHRPYACIHAELICETPPIRLRDPLNVAFPFITPLRKTKTPAILTRSAMAHMRKTARRRSFAMMGGLSYTHWAALQPESLLRRAIGAALYAGLKVDKLMLERVPEPDACPSVWSFWLCAALAEDTKAEIMEDLQSETCVAVRLRKIVHLLEQRCLRWKKRSREHDTAYRASLPKRRRVSTPPQVGGASHGKNGEDRDENSSSGGESVDEVLRQHPWPCSPRKGFEKVNLRYPCKGRFRLLPPSASPSSQPSTSTVTNGSELSSPD